MIIFPCQSLLRSDMSELDYLWTDVFGAFFYFVRGIMLRIDFCACFMIHLIYLCVSCVVAYCACVVYYNFRTST